MRIGSAVAQRHAAVLIWVPVLLARPVVDPPTGASAWASLGLVLVAATACAFAVVESWPEPTRASNRFWLVLLVAVLIGSLGWPGWSAAWLLVAMTAGATLPSRGALVAVPVCSVAAAATLARFSPVVDDVLVQAFVVALAGTTASVLSRLVVTTETLRRTREQLALAAVAHERERVARDLHDVLGHTLSVMVVKAAAVRRLTHSDPDDAASHAADIEDIGRSALSRVRQTIQNASAPTLEDELVSARDAFAAAGIETQLPTSTAVPPFAGEPLAWVLREGVTNVLRHSCARHCRVELAHSSGVHRLTIADDGANRSPADPIPADPFPADPIPADPDHRGGLAGLSRRLAAAGGGLEVTTEPGGFTLTAWVPDSKGRQ